MDLQHLMTDEEWKDITCFEGNANAFRLLTHQFNGRRKGGFVLTYSTLASIVKYPYASIHSDFKKQKFGFFKTEKKILKNSDRVGNNEISRQFKPFYTTSPGLFSRSCR